MLFGGVFKCINRLGGWDLSVDKVCGWDFSG